MGMPVRQMPTGRSVKIKGEYILSRRSIVRMIATITAALMSLYAATTAHDRSIVRRIHDATIGLVLLDRQMIGGTVRTVVPEIMYREYKSLYLELRRGDSPGRGGGGGHAGRVTLPADATGRVPPGAAVATKADLRAVVKSAVKTILRGEDVNAAKPGPRLTPAKRRQIEAAENYRATHCGCTLHNACLRSFVRAKDGYKSGKALYRVMLRTAKDDV